MRAKYDHDRGMVVRDDDGSPICYLAGRFSNDPSVGERVAAAFSAAIAGPPIATYPLQGLLDARQLHWDPERKLDLLWFSNEMGGECGEAQNAVKKIVRERLGLRGSRTTAEHAGEELADVVISACNVASKLEIDLMHEAVPRKFDVTSRANDLPTRWRWSR